MKYYLKHIFLFLICAAACTAKVYSQAKADTITGIIVDEKSTLPLDGVDIYSVSGSKKTVKQIGISNSNGSFKVAVPHGAKLKFQIVGYEDILLNPSDGMTVKLASSAKGHDLDQVVVQGFRSTSKELSTGASTTITAKDIQDVPASSVASLLQGKVAGLNIQINSGQPGAIASINLRGVNGGTVVGSGNTAFLTSTSPLFIIDGVPVDVNSNTQYGAMSAGPGMNPLALIPVEDIQSVEVLKDAAATAMYGQKGAYGVILITTKRGKSNIPIIQVSNMLYYSAVPKLRPTLGGKDERMTRINEILQNDTSYAEALTQINNSPLLSDSLNAYYNNATDWQSVFYGPKMNISSVMNISGGNNQFNYKTSLGYYNESGIIENTGLTRYSLGMNAQYQPTQRFNLQFSLTSSLASKLNGSGIGLLQTGVANAVTTTSLYPAPSRYSANGSALSASAIKDQSQTVYIAPSVTLRVEPVKNFQLNSVTSYNFTSNTQNSFQPGYTNSNTPVTKAYNDRLYQLYNRNTMQYLQVVQDVHQFMVMVASEMYKTQYTPNTYTIRNAANDYIQGPTGYAYYTGQYGTITDEMYDKRSASFNAEFNYNYKRKYIFDIQFITSSSSTNGPSAGWKKNPVYSLRWNFDKEKFFENASWLSYGSLRASYGKTTIPNGTIFDVYGTYASNGTFNGSQVVDLDYDQIPNDNFKPTTNSQIDLGFETGLFDNRINFIYDYFYKQTDDQNMSIDLPNISGFSEKNTNDFSLVNYGHEFTLNLRPLSKSSPVVWTLNANFSIYKTIVTKLPSNLRQLTLSSSNLPILYRLGGNFLTNLLYNYNGVFATDADVPINPFTGLPLQIRNLSTNTLTYATAGMPNWTDVNGDYIIDANDLLPLGNPNPKYTGGINSTVQYKQWQLQTSISYTLKRDILNIALADRLQGYTTPYSTSNLYPLSDLDYWTPTHTNAKYPNPFDYINNANITPFRYNSTMFMEDGSYWKLNSVTLSYNFDSKLIKRFHMQQARFYFTGANLLILTSYSGATPENVSNVGRDISAGYPNPKTYTFGLDIRF